MSKKIQVLVVEDDQLLLTAIGKKMELASVYAVLCDSGKTGLEKLEKGLHPDLIWLDYHLTDMDGLQFMHALQEKEEWKKIPVIVVSNSANDETIHAMMLLGAKKYLVKAENKLSDLIESAKAIVNS